jgi:hypothetical protein
VVDGLGAGRRLEMSTPESYEAGDTGARPDTRNRFHAGKWRVPLIVEGERRR